MMNIRNRLGVAFFLLGLAACRDQTLSTEPLPLGSSLPPLQAQGWLNAPAPSADALQNKIVVIAAWAYWCAPCLADMPKLVELRHNLADQPVQFIGLTAVEEDAIDETRLQLVRSKIDWPNGYGAAETLRQLGVTSLPAVFVFDRHGKLVWHTDMPGTLDSTLQGLLTYRP